MGPSREIVRADASLVVYREYNREAHADPARRGGYLVLIPGRTPEIVLDGYASEREQLLAEERCRRELVRSVSEAVEAGADQEKEQQRRLILRMDSRVVVSMSNDPVAHLDPARRGGYLMRVPGQFPEIVLDGLAMESERAAAEHRCLLQLEMESSPDKGGAGVARLKALLRERRRSSSTSKPPASASPAPSGSTRPSGKTGPPGASQQSRPSERTGPPGPSQRTGREQLGSLLLAEGLLTQRALDEALERQRALPAGTAVRRIGSLLVEARLVSLDRVLKALAGLRRAEAIPLTPMRVDVRLRRLLPIEALVELQAAPLRLEGEVLTMAMCDPHVADDVATLEALSSYSVRPLQALQSQVQRIIQLLRAH